MCSTVSLLLGKPPRRRAEGLLLLLLYLRAGEEGLQVLRSAQEGVARHLLKVRPQSPAVRRPGLPCGQQTYRGGKDHRYPALDGEVNVSGEGKERGERQESGERQDREERQVRKERQESGKRQENALEGRGMIRGFTLSKEPQVELRSL